MTASLPGDWEATLRQAVEPALVELRSLTREAVYPWYRRKAHATVRAQGEGYARGTAEILNQVFGYRTTGPDVYRNEGPAEPVVGGPVALVPEDQDEDEDDGCEHEDGYRCTRCGGLSEESCRHDFECGECGSERDTCVDCDLSQSCGHRWQCRDCDATDTGYTE